MLKIKKSKGNLKEIILILLIIFGSLIYFERVEIINLLPEKLFAITQQSHLETLTISGTTELCGNYNNVWDTVYVTSTGVLNICAFNGTAETGFVNMTLGAAGNFTVAPGGFVNGTARGGTGGAATTSTTVNATQGTNGNNWTDGAASTFANGGGGGGGFRSNAGGSASGGGGGFGGIGGTGGLQTAGSVGGAAGLIYGQTNNLTLHSGSGGGGASSDGGGAGGIGGAGFKINAGLGIINIQGFVNVSGFNGVAGSGQDQGAGGGGSGGHLILYASNITVDGAVINASGGSGGTAAGGADDCYGAGGGGGRIYLVYSTITNVSTTTSVLSGGTNTAGCSTDPSAGTAGTIRHNSTAAVFTNNAPKWGVSGLSVNDSNIVPGDFVRHNVNWTDDGELSYAILEVNATGAGCDTAANVTSVDSGTFNGTLAWSNLTWQIPAACEGKTIGWRIYAKDWPNNQTNVTELQAYQVNIAADTTPPLVTINFPQNMTYHSIVDTPYIFNISLNENGSAIYSLDGGVTNVTMDTTDNRDFDATIEYPSPGFYNFLVYANDTAGNLNSSENINFIVIQENIIVNGTIFDANGSTINTTLVITRESNDTEIYNSTNETNSVTIPLNDTYTIDIIPHDISSVDSVQFTNINFSEVNGTTTELVNIDETNSTENFTIFSIDPQLENFTNATVTFIAQQNALFKCNDWNFENRTCGTNWSLFMDNLEPGLEYNFTLESNGESYGIIEITEAIHLDENYTYIADIFSTVNTLNDVWSETIPAGHHVRVTFEKNLTSANDITIYPRTVSGSPTIQVYEMEGTELLATFTTLTDNQYNQILLTNLSGTQDTFDLRVLGGGVEFDHIIDPVLDQTGPTRSMDIEPINNNTFVIARINSSNSNTTRSELSITEYFTNGTIRRGPFHLDQTLGPVTAVSVEMINSTHLQLGWFDQHLLDELNGVYGLDGTVMRAPTTIDGANGGSAADTCLAHFGTSANRTFFGWVDAAEGDFDAAIVTNNATTTAFVTDTNIDATLVPVANFSNHIDCATINSSHAVTIRSDQGDVDATWNTYDFTLTARITDSDLDGDIGTGGAVAVAVLNGGNSNTTKRLAFAWYDGTDQDISYGINYSNNGTGVLGATDINTTAGTGSRIDVSTISNGTGPDNFVVVWYSQAADDLMAQTFDINGAALTSQFSIDSSTNATGLFNETAVFGKNGGSGWATCPGTWGVAYTNETGASIFKTYFVNGSSWDGNGCPTPAAAADTCTYTSGNWDIDCADNCDVSNNVNLGGNNVTLNGVGTVTLRANISNWRVGRSSGSCTIRTANGGGFKA